MSELVNKLSEGDHCVEISIRPEKTAKALQECIDKGYIHLKFTETRGGTDLYVPLDKEATDLGSSNFEKGTGIVKLVGSLTLDYIPVKCFAEIDLKTLSGKGRLQPVQS